MSPQRTTGLIYGVTLAGAAALAVGGGALLIGAAIVAQPAGTAAVVWDVYDGDTFRVTLADGTCCERVRVAAIDAPERGHRARCDAERELAEQARARAHALLRGPVYLDRLPEAEQEDRYGRTLAHVWAGGRDLGAALIADGLAVPWEGRRHDWCQP